MLYQRFGDRYQLRLESGDKVIGSLTRFAQQEGIGYASVSGLGAVRRATLAYYDVTRKEYERHDLEEQLEVASLLGNVCLKDGNAFLHVHATFGRRDMSVVGGHLVEAEAHSTVEVWMHREHEAVPRAYDEESGLSLMQLPDSFGA